MCKMYITQSQLKKMTPLINSLEPIICVCLHACVHVSKCLCGHSLDCMKESLSGDKEGLNASEGHLSHGNGYNSNYYCFFFFF